jgi:hypothetical protein
MKYFNTVLINNLLICLYQLLAVGDYARKQFVINFYDARCRETAFFFAFVSRK